VVGELKRLGVRVRYGFGVANGLAVVDMDRSLDIVSESDIVGGLREDLTVGWFVE
jgi:hypothetical protein